MSPIRIVTLGVAFLFVFGGLGLSAESSANDPWAVACFVIGGVIAVVALFWRRKP